MVQHSFPAPHTVADTEFDVLAAELALGLVKSRELVNHTITDIQGVQSSILNVNSDVYPFQPDLTDGFQRVPAETA